MELEEQIGRRAARKEDRRRAILAIAERSFLERGYADTSMSTIAAELGGSKTTLWSYFPGKEALFLAVLDSKIDTFAAVLDEALVPTGGTAAALGRFGRIYLAKIVARDSQGLKRLISAEAERFPTLAATFYERGPGRTRERFARYLCGEMAAGRLRAGDPMLAARQFFALCQAGTYNDCQWLRPHNICADIGREVGDAVDCFMRAWGLPEAGSPSPIPSDSQTG